MPSLSINEIREILPHRYPMLMVDQVRDYTDDWLLATKAVSVNEPVFQGHLPHQPIFPGLLVLEAMIQASAIMASLSLCAKADEKRLYLFAGIDKARFKRPVLPGNLIEIDTRTIRKVSRLWKTKATSKVDDQIICTADLLFTFQDL